VVWLLVVVLVIMPAFRLPSDDREASGNRALSHYEQVQEEPNLVWSWLTAERGPDALAWLLLPHGGLALLAPEVLAVALPGFLVLFLQDRAGTYAGHWSAPLLPVIWLAVAVGLGRLAARRRLLQVGLALLVAGTAVAYPLDSYFPGGRGYQADHYEYTALEASLRQAVDRVPPGASLVATRRVVPHLAARGELYQFPFSFYDAPLRPDQQRQDYYILDLTDSPTHRAVEPAESDSVLEKRPRYHLQRFGPSVLLLSKSRPEPEQPRETTFGGTLGLLGTSWPSGAPERWSGEQLVVGLFWTALQRAEGEPVRSLRLVGPAGATVMEASGKVVDDYLRFRDWDRGQVVAEWITLQPATPLPAGTYRLVVGWQDGGGRPLPVDGSGSTELELARIERR
jgi:hypothetical protein